MRRAAGNGVRDGLFVLLLASSLGLPLPLARAAAASAWSSDGPGGGSIYAIALAPSNPRTVYLASCGDYICFNGLTGVWTSVDGGGRWRYAGTGLPTFAGHHVTSLAVDPDISSTAYAGTFGEKVFKTQDAGRHWH